MRTPNAKPLATLDFPGAPVPITGNSKATPSTAVRELNEHMFDPRGHSSLALTL
jgi:hypothetical protein